MNRLLPALAVSLFAAFMLFGVAHAQQDIAPPNLVSIEFEPGEINTESGPQTITVTLRFTDDLSGFGSTWVTFAKPDTTQIYNVPVWDIHLLSGNAQDGTYQTTFEMSQYSAFGTWRLTRINATDIVGNAINLEYPDEPESQNGELIAWPAHYNSFTFRNGTEEEEPRQIAPLLYLPALGV